MKRWAYVLIVAALLIGGIAASVGDADEDVDLSAALEIWGNVLRDADEVGLKLTRVSASEEMNIGDQMAGWMSYGAKPDAAWTPYVRAVGESLVPYVRRHEIRYTFVVIESSEINAFAGPGGHVFVTTGLLQFVQSEAELAAILGHEISHVDLRHCIERYQYRVKLGRVGLANSPVAGLLEVGRWLVTSGYTKYQELEADAAGLRLAIQAGYDPAGGSAVMARMAGNEGERQAPRARTPVQEVGRALGGAVGAYFQSHPPSQERSQRLTVLVERNRRRLSGRECYVGRENLARKIPRSRQEFAAERRRL